MCAIYFCSLPSAIGIVQDGKVRALAVTGAKRSAAFPDCRRSRKPALPGYEAVLHYGIVAPAGTPRPIVDKLNAALRQALAEPDTSEAHGHGRHRAAAVHARGIRRRHRPRGDEVVGGGEALGRGTGEVSAGPRSPLARGAKA